MMKQKRPANLVSVKRKLTGGKSLIRTFHVLREKGTERPFRENTGTSKMRGFISVLPAERPVSVRDQVRLRFRMAEFLSAG